MNDQTIRGFRLAAVVVAFVILRRKNASASSEPPANTPPSGKPAPPASTSVDFTVQPANYQRQAIPARSVLGHEPNRKVRVLPARLPVPRAQRHPQVQQSQTTPPQPEPLPKGSTAQRPGGPPTTVTQHGPDADMRAFYEAIDNNTIDRGVWNLGPAARGEILHERLGQNLPRTFPGVDKFKDGVVTSIKSMDIHAKTYRNPAAIDRVGQGYVDKVAEFKGGTADKHEISRGRNSRSRIGTNRSAGSNRAAATIA